MRAVLVLFLCIQNALGVNLKIDGVIDLGPQWNYMYKILGNDDIERKQQSSHEIAPSRETDGHSDSVYHKVQEDETHHINRNKKPQKKSIDLHDTEPDIKESSAENSNESEDVRVTKIIGSAGDTENESSSTTIQHRFKTESQQSRGKKKHKRKEKHKGKTEQKSVLRGKDKSNSNEKFDKRNRKSKRDRKTKDDSDEDNANAKSDTNTFSDVNLRGVTEIQHKIHYKNNLFVKRHKIKDDSVADGFVGHVYRQALKTFDSMNLKVDGVSKSTIDTLKKTFKNKFGEFVENTREHSIRTRSGIDRLVLNAIGTSNRILRRLASLLTTQEEAEVLQKEIDKETDIEYKHACSKLGVCRTSTAFSDFLVEFLTKIITSSNDDIVKVSNALTEALKNTDFTDIIEKSTQTKFRAHLEELEVMPIFFVKAVFSISRSVIVGKNTPLQLTFNIDKLASNKTVATRELIQAMDEIMAKVANQSALEKVNQKLEDWKNGKTKDILSIMEQFVNTIKYALLKLNKEQKAKINHLMKTVLDHIQLKVVHRFD